MSAQQPPSADEIASELPVTPEEAEILADSLRPLQDLTGVGSSLGTAMEQAPGSGPKLIGSVLQHAATQTKLVSVSAETIARAAQFYIESQTQAADELFPPPSVMIEQVQGDIQPVSEVLRNVGGPGE